MTNLNNEYRELLTTALDDVMKIDFDNLTGEEIKNLNNQFLHFMKYVHRVKLVSNSDRY